MIDLTHPRRAPLLVSVLLACLTLATYWPVLRHQFVNYDDPDYVTENSIVQQGLTLEGAKWAFLRSHAANWHPLTWLSHMLDCQWSGLDPARHHLTSLLFHAANTILLFLLLRSLSGATWPSALVAALFAVHPLHVQSVAWVAERKDVLSTFFGLLSLLAYGRYARSGTGAGNGCRRWSWYALAWLWLALGLLSKPMLITLPFLFLLLDFWPLRRTGWPEFNWPAITRLVLEKLPFLVLVLGSCVVTFLAQRSGGSVESLEAFPLRARIANALVACVLYLWKMCWPVKLSAFYPYVPLQGWEILGAGLLLLAVTLVANRLRRIQPWLIVGWLWFLIMLGPVLGIVQVGAQSMADRYTYLPIAGVFLALVWSATEVGRARGVKPQILAAAGAALIVLCCMGTRFQLGFWQDSISLFSRAVEVTSRNALAHYNLGSALGAHGELGPAIQHYREALNILPDYADAHNNLGCLASTPEEAALHLQEAVRLSPKKVPPRINLGNLLAAQGKFTEAVAQCTIALQLAPGNRAASDMLASVLARAGGMDALPPETEAAVKLLAAPQLRAQVADAWMQQRKFGPGLRAYRLALELSPAAPEILNALAWGLATCPQDDARNGSEAVQLARKACELTEFKRAETLGTLAAAYAEAGKFDEAVATAAQAKSVASASNQPEAAGRIERMAALFREHKPCRQTP